MTWTMLRYRLRRTWRKARAILFPPKPLPAPLESFGDKCEHDVQPTADPDWGACVKCKAGGFPMTMRAAYGDVECEVCSDTGLVPDLSRPHVFADKQCPACPRHGIRASDL